MSKTSSVHFSSNFTDIEKEFRKVGTVLGSQLAKELAARDVPDQLLDNVLDRLSARYPFAIHVPVGRIERLKQVLRYQKRVKSSASGSGAGGYKTTGTVTAKTTLVQIGNIKALDTYTQIARLDKGATRMRHYSPWDGNPKKKNSGSAARRFHLWRLLEFPRRSSYRIASTASRRSKLAFTTSRDGFSQFHRRRWVSWSSTALTGSSKFYFLLDAQRELYAEDKAIVKRSVEESVRFLIANKTRFHK